MTERVAAFLDRDGVINEDRRYVHDIDNFHFLPGALEACRRLVAAGYLLIIVTNQAGIARGYYGVRDFDALTAWMSAQFTAAGAPLAAVYYCPHHPEGVIAGLSLECDCRKPAPGLFLRAQRDLKIDMRNSIAVGDKDSDIAAAQAAGVGRCFLMDNAASHRGSPLAIAHGYEVVSSLLEAADAAILARLPGRAT